MAVRSSRRRGDLMFGQGEFLCCGDGMDATTDAQGRFTHTCPDCDRVIYDHPEIPEAREAPPC